MDRFYKTEGGPAFPSTSAGINYAGMSLRDWLAGMALASGSDGLTSIEAAERAYGIADAMLALKAEAAKPARPPVNPVSEGQVRCDHAWMRDPNDMDRTRCVKCGLTPYHTTGHTLGDFQL